MDPHPERMEQLTAYLDGELSADQRAQVEQLLADDTEARRLLDHLRQTSRLIADLPRGQASEDFSDVITTRLERHVLLGETSRSDEADVPRGSWSRKLAIAASFVLICTAAWLGWPELSNRNKSYEPILLTEKTGKDLENLSDSQIPEKQHLALRSTGASPLQPKSAGDQFDQQPDQDAITVQPKRVASLGLVSKKSDATVDMSKLLDKNTDRSFSNKTAQQQAETKETGWLRSGSSPNRLEIVTDEATIGRLVKLITIEMAGHDIHTASMDEKSAFSAKEDAPFYSIRYRETRFSQPADDANQSDIKQTGKQKMPREVHIAMSIRRNLVETLLSAMQRLTDDQESEAIWTLNGECVSAVRLACGIQQHSEGTLPDRIASGQTSPAGRSANDLYDDSEEAADDEWDEEPSDEDEPSDRSPARRRETHRTKAKADINRGQSPIEGEPIGSQDTPKEKRLISWVLTLRSQIAPVRAASAPATTAPVSSIAPATASDQPPKTPTSHPTEEGSPGG